MSGTLAADTAGTASIEKVQFIYGGRNYCFYPEGWHGPGWYWCGYASRRGLGWGGGEGWRGWHHGRHEERHHDDHHNDHHDNGHHHR